MKHLIFGALTTYGKFSEWDFLFWFTVQVMKVIVSLRQNQGGPGWSYLNMDGNLTKPYT